MIAKLLRLFVGGKQRVEMELPKPGELWIFNPEDPFESKYAPVKILDVKDGWVRYYMGWAFPDERMKASSFVKMYGKYKENS